MTSSVYIIGGAGTGKSTFTQELLERVGEPMGPLLDLHRKPNGRGTMITLRGHEIGSEGLYLGCMRDSFPGTDGLDRVSYIPGEEWLATAALPEFIIAEGATLAVRRFLYALSTVTDTLLVYLTSDDLVKEIRLAQRGAGQDEKFITATATRARNLAVEMAEAGVQVWEVDTGDQAEWEQALDVAMDHLF